ncbi:MAG: flagellar biosynthesis anti-sigma factor FlgM [Gemmatimonadota bacterium]|nr:flagellar biosynthesis anti-sigma factor FlgM [Gemmatimonadota bacterium]
MKIDHALQRTKAQELEKQSKTEKSRDAVKKKDPDGRKIRTDTVTISEKARSLQRTDNKLKVIGNRSETASPVRRDKVELAKAKIQSGELSIDKVVEGTAESILKSGAISDVIDRDKLQNHDGLSSVETPEASPQRLAEIKERIKSGYYDSPEVTERIADNILDDLLG